MEDITPAKGIRLVGVTLSSFERADKVAPGQLDLAFGNVLADKIP
jgi:hypothetical protein